MVVFDRPGSGNTSKTLELAAAKAAELDIRTALVATTSGATGLAAAEALGDLQVVVVTHSTGFSKPGQQEIDPDKRDAIRAAGAQVLTATHAFGGVGRAVRRKFATYQVDEIIAQTLRLFGQGTKVAVEMAVMAADAGLVPVDAPVMAIAGTGRGADTAVVLTPAHAQDLFELKVHEIVCKPRL